MMFIKEPEAGRLAHEPNIGQEFAPGAQAPVAGAYEQRNVLGTATGVRVIMAQGESLPLAPRGFTWALVEASEN